ncbi:MAG: hypothetical protein ACP5XB_19305, partial [Isosphaeraceae bacterium]
MLPRRLIVLSVIAACLVADAASAIEPSTNERGAAGAWVQGTLESRAAASLPFSFGYGGKPSGGLIGSWKRDVSVRTLESGRTERTISLIDPANGLEVRCVAATFDDFPAVEWMLTFKNGGQADTPILTDVQALDACFGPGLPGRRFRLYHAAGSRALVNDFQPRQTELGENGLLNLASSGGRSSDGNLPFFNLAFPGGGGVALAIGWTGQWAASFRGLTRGRIQIRAGMELVHTTLHPGEEIRS